MSLYAIVFIIVTVLLLIGLGIFAWIIMKIDKWIDKKERLGRDSIYKTKNKTVTIDKNDNKRLSKEKEDKL